MEKKDDSAETWKQLAGAGESILACAILVALGVWGGGHLDERFHTAPLLQVGLALLGAGLGLARMVMRAMQSEKK